MDPNVSSGSAEMLTPISVVTAEMLTPIPVYVYDDSNSCSDPAEMWTPMLVQALLKY